MSTRAFWESDSLAPEKLTQRPLTVDLQLSINARLMERLDALEEEVKTLRQKVSDLNGWINV